MAADEEKNHKDEPKDKSSSTSDSAPIPEKVDQASSDALSKTPDELEEEAKSKKSDDNIKEEVDPFKKAPLWRRILARVNIYLLAFIFICILAGIILLVYYFNGQKPETIPTVGSQPLTTEALKALANNDVKVGDNTQTLTIQGNAIIDGQTLMRGNLNVAGNLQTGGSITAPQLTISGTSNLGTAQINNLQVAQNTSFQGITNLRDISVGGTATFGGLVTVGEINISRLVMSGASALVIPNHILFSGPNPSRTYLDTLGQGGTGSIDGSDTSGTIKLNSGNSPSAGCAMRIRFNVSFNDTPRVLISPVGSAAAGNQYYVDRDAEGFDLCFKVAPPSNQVFAYDYFIAGKEKRK